MAVSKKAVMNHLKKTFCGKKTAQLKIKTLQNRKTRPRNPKNKMPGTENFLRKNGHTRIVVFPNFVFHIIEKATH